MRAEREEEHQVMARKRKWEKRERRFWKGKSFINKATTARSSQERENEQERERERKRERE